MAARDFRVILLGPAAGTTHEQLAGALAPLFKTSPERMRSLVARSPSIIKRGMDEPTAMKIRNRLEQAGARARVEPEGSLKGGASPRQDPMGVRMICPKCNTEQPEAASCAHCGIIIAKFRAQKGASTDEAPRERVDSTNLPSSTLATASRIIHPLRGTMGGVAFLLIILLVGAEFLLLSGEEVTRRYLPLGREDAFVAVPVERTGIPYQVSIQTKERLALYYALETDQGRIVYEKTEHIPHEGYRKFRFTPPETGTYRLYVQRETLVPGSVDRARIIVRVNDRRVLGSLFSKLKF
ncbi:MAG: CHY zinc finger protein [Thermodesulfobacteriota bacterium]